MPAGLWQSPGPGVAGLWDSDRLPGGSSTASSALLAGGTTEHEKLCRARDQCREILKYVNEAVRHAENRHRVEGYQKRLDTTSLDRASNPLAAEFKVGAKGAASISRNRLLGMARDRGHGLSVRMASRAWACTYPRVTVSPSPRRHGRQSHQGRQA